MSDAHQTVEHLVRSRLAEALGGRRGVIESAIPTIIFTIGWIISSDLRLSLTLAIAVTAVLLVIRIVQRSSVQFVLNALVAIGIAALFAARSGEARDVFLPGILYNAGYAAVFIFTIAIGWPAVGFMIGSIVGDPTGWRKDEALRKVCTTLTWLFALPCIVRVLVQYPLYVTDHVAWLGTSKIVLGWPLQVAAFAAMAWVLSRDKTPMEDGLVPETDASPATWIVEAEANEDDRITFGPPGFAAYARVEIPSPDEFSSDADFLSHVIALLARHTETPEQLYVGVWEGWGHSDPPGVRFEIPHRRYALLSGPAGAVLNPQSLRIDGHHPATPHLVWPTDRAWLIAWDVDEEHHFTVAGSTVALTALLAEASVAGKIVPYGPTTSNRPAGHP